MTAVLAQATTGGYVQFMADLLTEVDLDLTADALAHGQLAALGPSHWAAACGRRRPNPSGTRCNPAASARPGCPGTGRYRVLELATPALRSDWM